MFNLKFLTNRQAHGRTQNKGLHLQINKYNCGAKMQEYFNINLHKLTPWKCL